MLTKHFARLTCGLAATLTLAACAGDDAMPDWADTPADNFDALWTIVDRRYCFFDRKDVDWQAVYDSYRPRISDEMTREELFDVCAEMLDELRDGHVNLVSGFNTSAYREWWSGYPEDFSLRVIQEKYFNFNYRQASGMIYGFLPQNIGYIYYSTFSQTVGDGNLDNILYYLSTADGLIFDVRNNGGGELTNVETLVSRFIDRPTLVGYISHKTGPGHSDFSAPYEIIYRPASEGHQRWGKPVVVLANHSTYSAANNFVAVMKNLPQVKIAGAPTGGGAGIPFSSELPCGWSIRMSSAPMLDALGRSTEEGVDPTPGCEATVPPGATDDPILDLAVRLLTE